MNLRTFIKWVILIQIQFCQLLWVLGGEKKWWARTYFEIFQTTNSDLSTSSPISQKWNILISTHPIVKLKIVLEILGSGEDMVKNLFSDFYFFTSGNPCDSSPPPRRNHEPGTPEKFSKHGFSFFNPNIPLSLETRTKRKIGLLFHENPHLNSKNHFWQKSKKNSKANCKKPNLVYQNWVLTKKYWLNFLELPFSSRHQRPETMPNLPPKTFFPLTGYLALVCTYPEWIWVPRQKLLASPCQSVS